MDFTLMIIARQGRTSGDAITSQLKSFPTKTMADMVAERIAKQASSYVLIDVIKLYLE